MGTLFIQDVYKIAGIGIVPVGKVEKGTIRVGMRTTLEGKTFEIKSIEIHHMQMTVVNQGDNVGISIQIVGAQVSTAGREKSFFQKIFSKYDGEYATIKKYVGRHVEFS